ncbi:hypothetical protein, partial [Aeromonas veronii]|uniref:hypothetical protein n=1 Tax=Aeromonas veronii TaxID=654 RepID=UPI003D25F03D
MRAGAMHGYWWLVASLLFGFPCHAAVVKVTAEYNPACVFRLTQSFHFFLFEPIFSPVNALNQPI